MDSQISRSAWVGAGSALLIGSLVLIAAGGSHPKDAPPAPVSTLQAPTPTLEPVSPNPSPSTPSASTQVQAHPKATPSQDKESQ
jgi:hypothetical protein